MAITDNVTSDTAPEDIPDTLIEIKQAALLRLINAAIGGGGSTEVILTAIKDAIVAQGTVTLSTEGTQLLVEANLDDVEELLRDLGWKVGTQGADTGAAVYSEIGTADLTATQSNNNTTIITITGALSNYEQVAKAGDTLKLSGTPNDGTYEILAVDGLQMTINAQFSFPATGATATIRITDDVNPVSILGRLLTLAKPIGTTASTTPTEGILIGVDDAGNLIAATADATTKGLNSHVVSAPAHTTGSVYKNGIFSADGLTEKGTSTDPLRTLEAQPSTVIDLTAAAGAAATNPFVGAPLDSVNIQNGDAANDIYIGNSVSQNTKIGPGLSASGFKINDLSKLYIRAPVGAPPVNIFGS